MNNNFIPSIFADQNDSECQKNSLQASNKKLDPIDHLNAFTRRYPKAWKAVDAARKHKLYGSSFFPTWCFAPFAAYEAIITIYRECEGNQETFGDIEKLAALSSWRYTQGVYEFEQTIYESISNNKMTGNIPVDVIYRMPEWCVYIKTTDFGDDCGFFAHLEYDHVSEVTRLKFLLDDREDLYPVTLHLGEWTVEEALNRFFTASAKQHNLDECDVSFNALVEKTLTTAQKCLSLLLYLCTDEPDIERIENELPQRQKLTKTKKGMRLFPPKKPKIWQVGKRLAKQIIIPKEATGKTHKSPIPHIRRGHFHGVWVGKRNSPKRKFIYNWWHPTVINAAA